MPETTEKVTPAALISTDISADGVPLKTTAAPVKSTTQQDKPSAKSIQDLEKVDDTKTPEQLAEEKIEEDNSKVDFDQFLEASGKPKSETKVEEKKVETVPKDDKDTSLEQKEKVVTKDEKQKVSDDARDYSEIDEKDVSHFKRMSNDAFNALKPIYKEYKKLKTDITAKDTELKTINEQFKK